MRLPTRPPFSPQSLHLLSGALFAEAGSTSPSSPASVDVEVVVDTPVPLGHVVDTVTDPVLLVDAASVPVDVDQSIVGRVPVAVDALHSIWTWSNEDLKHQAMDEPAGRRPRTNGHLPMATAIRSLLAASAVRASPYAAHVGNVVAPFEARHWKPSLPLTVSGWGNALMGSRHAWSITHNSAHGDIA